MTTEFRIGDRVIIDKDPNMPGTVHHVERQATLTGLVQVFVHVQFDHLLNDPTEPGLLLPCGPQHLSYHLPLALTPEGIEQWLAT